MNGGALIAGEMSRTPVAVDLFSGCGGLTLGLKQAGFTVCGAIDVDPLAVETYRANHPEVSVWKRDIRSVHPRQMRRKLGLRRGALDLLAGCPPCEGFSTMRTRNGSKAVDDPQNDLVYEFIRFVREFRPKAIMIENVPALDRDERIVRLGKVLRALGYEFRHRVLNAADYGVPQRRRRMILLASRFGRVRFARRTRKGRTVRGTIERLPPPGDTGDQLHDLGERRSQRISRLIKQVPKDGGSRIALGKENQLECHVKCDGFKDVYGRMAWDCVSPTITSGCTNPSKGRFLHPDQDRAITLRESALLQSFPNRYVFSMKRGKGGAATLIGNALPPEFVRRHALAILKTAVSDPEGRDRAAGETPSCQGRISVYR